MPSRLKTIVDHVKANASFPNLSLSMMDMFLFQSGVRVTVEDIRFDTPDDPELETAFIAAAKRVLNVDTLNLFDSSESERNQEVRTS